MGYTIPLWLGLIVIIPASGTPPSQAPGESLCVFADLKHTGSLTGPLTSSPTAPDEFGIAVPLPARSTDRDRLPKRFDAGDRIAERLGRLRVETTNTTGDVVVSIDSDSRRWLRLYRQADGAWRRLPPSDNQSWTFAPADDGALELGVGVVMPEAKTAGVHPAWPRAFTVLISSGAPQGHRVRVPFRVAPYIIPSALEPVEELMIVSQHVTEGAVREVEWFAARAGVKLIAHETDEPSDQWMQDAIQPGLFAFPTAPGSDQARVCLTGLRRESSSLAAALDYEVAKWLRRQGVVTALPGLPRKRTRWIDGYGNLEATPPFSDRAGRRFPFGRVITGKQRELTMHPGVMKFLEAQEVQWPPIVVDTSWLAIAHVDEVVNFIPAKTKVGFKVLLPSPSAARDLLEALLAQGLEAAPVFADTEDEMTLGKLQLTIAGTTENTAIDESVARLREQLKSELNLEDADFVMVPVLFERGVAVIPNAVNSMVVNGHLLVPEPRGPRQGPKDAFEEAIRTALAGCDVQVVFIDSWDAYHLSGGEIHCGTNTFRRLRDPAWWTYVGNANDRGK